MYSSPFHIGRSCFSCDGKPLEAVLHLVPVGEGSGHPRCFYSASQQMQSGCLFLTGEDS